MLSFITEIPEGKQIGSVYCVPVLDNGDVVMVWDRYEKVLTPRDKLCHIDDSIEFLYPIQLRSCIIMEDV
ncbi:hypothetical protein BK123_25495 [Paenibacillus lautus]|uniref:Uncharacterized protein n=1 Tax=Paenibacillus lautus TaxID=1401 RepID=A0A1R1AVY3_PAELA|nr:hypothetical protein BK123_25495 [Paenibacillus lautus]